MNVSQLQIDAEYIPRKFHHPRPEKIDINNPIDRDYLIKARMHLDQLGNDPEYASRSIEDFENNLPIQTWAFNKPVETVDIQLPKNTLGMDRIHVYVNPIFQAITHGGACSCHRYSHDGKEDLFLTCPGGFLTIPQKALAFVLSHELGHLANRDHENEEMKKLYATVDAKGENDLRKNKHPLIMQIERNADAYAVEMLGKDACIEGCNALRYCSPFLLPSEDTEFDDRIEFMKNYKIRGIL